MKVFTYFDPTVPAGVAPSQSGVLRLWADSWRKWGWQPRILGPRSVTGLQGFPEFQRAVKSFPTVNDRTYENACYFRWLALEAAGGGWMTDYDVINMGFRPRPGVGRVEMLDCTYVPCAVWASAAGAKDIVRVIKSHQPTSAHVSDMLIFKTQFDKRQFGIPGLACVEFGVAGWKEAPLVHFSAGKTLGFPNKVAAIQSVLNAQR